MASISVEHLTFSYPGSYDTIFQDVTFRIDTDWKLGFVGRNGRGKTTFLHLLQGWYPYEGRIQASVPFDYFPYPVKEPGRKTLEILEEACPQGEEWEFLRELSQLEVEEEALERPFATLSQGEQTKVLLAALFLQEGHFQLIDEPTNHLDQRTRALVSAYLNRKKGFLLVSHDRCFLDGCVDHILALNRRDIQVQRGNFSSWMTNFQRQQDFELAQNARLNQEIAALQKAAGRSSQWSQRTEAAKYGNGPVDRGFVGHKSAKMMKRAKVLEARQQQALRQKEGLLHNRELTAPLKLTPLSYPGDALVTVNRAAPVYGGRPVCAPVTFTLAPGDRVALDGPNGSGKSSLLKVILGEPIQHSGTVTVGSGLRVSYVPQSAEGLTGDLSRLARAEGLEESLFKAILRKMGFERVQFDKDIRDFSAGQKKKVLLAKSLCERAHLYVWDEPLNYIDIDSRMQLEELIRQYTPTMIFVEHDRAFREAVATRTISL